MVELFALASGAVILAQEKQLPLDRLDPATRAKVLAALAGLIILGFAMLALVWLGARVTRRYMNPPSYDRQRPDNRPSPDDWATKPLNVPLSDTDDEDAARGK
jgi:hypothetical protein